MELHRGCPGNVDAEIAFRVIRFSITRKRILLSTSISHVKASMVLPSTSLPLVLVLPVAHPHPLCSARLFLMRGEMFVLFAICDCLNTTMRSIPLLSTDSNTKEPKAMPSANDLPAAKAGSASSAAARSRGKKFLSYYKPYLGLFFADMACALLVSAITLLLPLCARYITKNILEGHTPDALNHIYLVGALMLALVGVHTLCTIFIDFP